jgi:hypothetical protein
MAHVTACLAFGFFPILFSKYPLGSSAEARKRKSSYILIIDIA